jgi:hypothetical protein
LAWDIVKPRRRQTTAMFIEDAWLAAGDYFTAALYEVTDGSRLHRG